MNEKLRKLYIDCEAHTLHAGWFNSNALHLNLVGA